MSGPTLVPYAILAMGFLVKAYEYVKSEAIKKTISLIPLLVVYIATYGIAPSFVGGHDVGVFQIIILVV